MNTKRRPARRGLAICVGGWLTVLSGCGASDRPSVTAPSVGTVAGTVTSSLGGAISGATVSVTTASGVTLPSVTTTSTGAYDVPAVPVGSGAGTVTVTGMPSNCATGTASYAGLTLGATATANVTLSCTPPVGYVAGTVTSSLGDAISGATVTVAPTNGVALPSVLTTSTGVYAVSGVPVGAGPGAGSGTVTVSRLPGNCAAPVPVGYAGLTNGATATANITASCQPISTTLMSCRTIGVSGSYTLATNISSTVPDSACLTINADNVALDCAGHTLATVFTAIAILPVRNVTINNCAISGTGNGYFGVIDIYGSQGVSLTNSSVTTSGFLGAAIHVDSAQRLTVTNCTLLATATSSTMGVYRTHQVAITGGRITAQAPSDLPGIAFSSDSSSNITLANNLLTSAGSPAYSVVWLVDGGSNTIRNNQIDGSWNGDPGTLGQQGADDGIVLISEHGDTVQANTVSNVWDAGFESISALTNTLIAGNTFTNTGFTGIGAYYGTSWVGNKILGNSVSASPSLAYIMFVRNCPGVGDCPADSVTTILFQGNTFRGDSLRNPVTLAPSLRGRIPASVVINFSGLNEQPHPLPLPFAASNDTIAGEYLPSSLPSFYLAPAAAFVDGGGNVCNVYDPGTAGWCRSGIAGMGTEQQASRLPSPLPPHPYLRMPPLPRHVKPPHKGP
jgi:parallel beta-helix repeat protein